MNYSDAIEMIFKKEKINFSILKDFIFSIQNINEKYRKVLTNIAKIPYGKIISYSEFAEVSGFKDQTRSIASAIGKNPIPISLFPVIE